MRLLPWAIALLTPLAAAASPAGTPISTGQTITPTASRGAVFTALNPHIASEPAYLVGQAETAAASPDGKTLLILTSGFNKNATAGGVLDKLTSTEFVFVFDISAGRPVQKQALPVPNAFSGIAWAPDGKSFYVGGGKDDDIHVFKSGADGFAESGAPIALHDTAYGTPHPSGNALFSLPALGQITTPLNGGLAVTADGATLIVAEVENDRLNAVNLATGAVTPLELRPGRLNPAQRGVPGGEFPYWVAVTKRGVIYVSSLRDREIDVLAGAAGQVTARIKLAGNPNRLVLNKAQTRLFVTADNADMLSVIDTATNRVLGRVRTTAPAGLVHGPTNGAAPSSVTLSPDEHTAYVTNASMNAVAVIDVRALPPVVTGLIPTGWEPTSVATSADGSMLYVINAQGITGPNPLYPKKSANQYEWQMSKAGFLTLPTPSEAELAGLTAQVAANNGFAMTPNPTDAAMMGFLHSHIRHVIYIVKENRTYDQILGDLGEGNGDPALAMYGSRFTPNFHAIAKQFVDLDNYYDPSLSSMDGWQFSTAGRVQDFTRKVNAVNYGKGGGSYDSEGTSRDVNVGLATPAARIAASPIYGLQAGKDPDLLPGTANEEAPDGPGGEQGAGFIWSQAARAGLSIRNYGFLCDLTPYSTKLLSARVPVLRDPFATRTVVAFPATVTLQGVTDPYFRSFDNNLPDFYRFAEWAREFGGYVATGRLPAFETVRFMHDHTGDFATAIDGVNTPELQQADNDYAVGLLLDRLAHSRYAKDTLVFVTEDDSQDGPDHVDSHRSTGYVVGPYVKHGVVVSTRYSTVSMLRTMSDILGLKPLDEQIAATAPMTDVFDEHQAAWDFAATPAAALLTNTQLPISGRDNLLKHASLSGGLRLRHDAAWWADKTRAFDFSREDLNDEYTYNRVLWVGTMGDQPYPAGH